MAAGIEPLHLSERDAMLRNAKITRIPVGTNRIQHMIMTGQPLGDG